MREVILEKLKEIEEKEQVKILHAVESGSRAWGFASPDSDYDVRFIYVHPTEYYLKLEKTRDVIEWQLDETLDINGWDLRKALVLLHKSNPTLFEWNNSPIIYRTTPLWAEISEQIGQYFSCKSGLYHYLSTANGNYQEYLQGEQVRLKKYFYVLRPILACKWILDKHCPPPMLFSELMEEELEPTLKPLVEQLLEQKKNSLEIGKGPQIPELNQYIEQTLKALQQNIMLINCDGPKGWEQLNHLFLKAIKAGKEL